ncbi:MAG: hypothetical protein HC818_01155 [Synechococcaceae cyanobacterium RM1_1_27]|nr:hypothetical protein [Synechococcaceae cyanobacterium SM2_3_2]NJO85464.1 hypothetical protein [Synechococcaceae cyanobacterium RM1_1_27]
MSRLIRVGRDGNLVLPPDVLQHLPGGADVMMSVEVMAGGQVMLNPVVDVETYSPERQQEFAEADQMTAGETTRVRQVLATLR